MARRSAGRLSFAIIVGGGGGGRAARAPPPPPPLGSAHTIRQEEEDLRVLDRNVFGDVCLAHAKIDRNGGRTPDFTTRAKCCTYCTALRGASISRALQPARAQSALTAVSPTLWAAGPCGVACPAHAARHNRTPAGQFQSGWRAGRQGWRARARLGRTRRKAAPAANPAAPGLATPGAEQGQQRMRQQRMRQQGRLTCTSTAKPPEPAPTSGDMPISTGSSSDDESSAAQAPAACWVSRMTGRPVISAARARWKGAGRGKEVSGQGGGGVCVRALE